MKKPVAFFVCLFLIFSAAFAAESYVSDGSPLQLEDFTLSLNAGMRCTLNPREAGKTLVTVHPYAAENDYAAEFMLLWEGGPLDCTPESLNETRDTLREDLASGLQGQGNTTVDSIGIGEAYEAVIGSEPCLVLDATVEFTARRKVTSCIRLIYFNDRGYIGRVIAETQEKLEDVTGLLDSMLAWN